MKKALSLVLALGMMVSMLAACGSDDTASTNTSTSGESSSSSAFDATAGENVVTGVSTEVDMDAEPAGVQAGTSVAVGSSVDFVTQLLPNTFNGGRWFYNNVYDSLFWDADNDGLGGDPLIVDTYTTSEDGLTWVLDLHEDIYFHNGNQLTADSVIGSLAFVVEYDLVTLSDSIKSMEATGEFQLTVEIYTIGAETPDFMGLYVFDYTSYEEKGYTADAALGAGSGPYEIVSYAIGDNIKLQAVEDHWNPDRQAHIESCTVQIISNTTTSFNALASGELDYGTLGDYSYFEQIKDSADHQILTLDAAPSVIWMNCVGFCEYLADPLVREALCLMVDDEQVMLAATGGYGHMNENILNASFTAYSQDRTYDPEAGLALLEEAGVDPADIVINPICNSGTESSYVNIQSQLMNYGITVSFVVSDQNVVMTAGTAGEWDMWTEIGGLEAAPSYYNSIKNIMAHTAAQVVVTDPELRVQVADLVDVMGYTTDYDAYIELVAEVCQICDENYLYLCAFNGPSWNCYSARIMNPVVDTTCGQWRVYESWIAE